jgi:hypothetical protein
MLFRKQYTGIRKNQNIHRIVFLPLFIAVMIVISSCSAPKDSIVILENPNGKEFTMSFKKFSRENKCKLSLNEGDVVLIEIACEDGEISFSISGKNGSEPYTGNNLQSCRFTVTVSQTDEYVFRIKGKAATGKITASNLGPEA